MSTDSSENFVERRDIPAEAQKLYHSAEKTRETFAQSLAYNPEDAAPEFTMTKKTEDQLMEAVENSYTNAYGNADRSKYRPLKSSMFKRAMVIFFEGKTTIGLEDSRYMALIPFFVLGNVTIGGTTLGKGWCYDVFGKCILDVPEGGRVGSWVISHVK